VKTSMITVDRVSCRLILVSLKQPRPLTVTGSAATDLGPEER
jgi:hypothetical protein